MHHHKRNDLSSIHPDSPQPQSQPQTQSQSQPHPRRDRSIRELTGILDRILWCSDDNELLIARLLDGTVVKGPIEGNGLTPSTAYRFLGRWETHHKHGEQFAFSTYVLDTPADPNGQIKYLADNCKGVGRAKAARLVEQFGSATVEIVRTDSSRVAATGIITADQAREAADALAKIAQFERTKIDLFGLFAGRGFHGRLVAACINRWGARAAQVVRQDPFRLLVADMPSAGFKRCDKLYLELGNRADRLKRQMFCLWNELHQDSNGHTWIEAAHAARAIELSVGRQLARPVQAARLGKRVRWLASWKDHAGKVWLAEADKARAEWRLSEAIRRLREQTASRWPQDGFDGLSDHQAAAIEPLLGSTLAILAGTPGTGKTYTAAAIIKRIVEQSGTEGILVCAPTGKAAVRITAALHAYGIPLEARTIHRALEINRNGHDGKGWAFGRNLNRPFDQRYVIVDECSMLDTNLAADLLEACGDGTHVLLIGDPYQLPPVGHGAPLRDMIASGVVPCAELTEIRRNAGMIVHACAAIKDGKRFETTEKVDFESGANLRLIETNDEQSTLDTILALLRHFRAGGKLDAVWDVQVIVAVNAKSRLGRLSVNRVLQAELNPTGHRAPPNPFRVGDKIICLKNSSMQLVVLSHGCDSDAARRDAASYEPMRDLIHGGTREEFVANGEIGRVLAAGPRQTIARFMSPDRTILIVHGKGKGSGGSGSGSGGGDAASASTSTDSSEAPGSDQAGGGSDPETSSAGCDFDLAYAVTCHKMQGSESPVIICPIDSYAGARRIATREWHYTAISRARTLCLLVGQRGVIDAGCRRVSLQKRKTFLKELLAPAGSETGSAAGGAK